VLGLKFFPSENPTKPPISGPFSDLENFRRKPFTMGMLQSKLPLIIIVVPDSCIVNRQIVVKVYKFLVVSGSLPTGHVTLRMRNGHFRQYYAA